MDRSKLPTTRNASIEFYRKFLTGAAEKGEEHVQQAKRWLARNDLFYLMVAVCGRKDVNRDWLFDRCREVEAAPNGFLDLWAREHFKSSIITFGMNLQDILASHGEDPEPRYNGQEVTIGIFSHTRPIAKAFLRQIKNECEQNQTLKDLFPDVVWAYPKSESPKWSEDEGLVFKRKGNPKEATIEAWGLVDAQPTSKHFQVLCYDDIVTKESVTSEMIKKTTEAWELSTNLGTEGGVSRYAGTRYAAFDTYYTMMERGVPSRVHACTSDGSEDWSKSVLMKPETLAEKRRKQGVYTFGAQMLLDPTADKTQGFRKEWLKYWPCESFAGLNFYIVVDPASKKKKDSDWTAMWVVGVGGDGNWYICDVIHDRLNLTERAKALMGLHRKWRHFGPIKEVGYERYGKDSDIEHIEYVQGEDNYRFDITEVGGGMHKHDRIRRLVPKFEDGRIFLPECGIIRKNHEGLTIDIIHKFVHDQYTMFPVSQFDDLLDSLARMHDLPITIPEPVPVTSRGQHRSKPRRSAWAA